MHCVVTAGPTYESLDTVRRLTNFSTGRLGCELAGYLLTRGHEVTLLIGEQATYCGARQATRSLVFSTTRDLHNQLRGLSTNPVDALFHAAAVSDFTFGKVWLRSADGQLSEIRSGKISTRNGTLLAELVPTRKIIGELRGWFPKTRLVGWKYEVEGDRSGVLAAARRQISECGTDACVANGPAYGKGFGLVTSGGELQESVDAPQLFIQLEKLVNLAP
jgi:phosphopantothenoylcysteine decarboxylase/phosphopantothenate--cysteine ligase